MTNVPVDPDRSGSGRPLHRQLPALAVVFAGGAVGTLARYGTGAALPHGVGSWPTGTFLVNIVGAFALGLLLEALVRSGPDDGWRRRTRLLAGTGFCGAFTTYSSFALETTELARGGAAVTALAYLGVTVVLGLAAAWAGIATGNAAVKRRVK